MTEEAIDPLVHEALEWFVRMRDEAVSAADKRAFEAWLAADEAHAKAWIHAEELWTRLDVAQPEFDRLKRSRTILSRRNIVGGSVALLGGLGGLYAYRRPELFAGYKTDVAERRTFALPDGSSVELGSASAFSTRFTATERSVDLFSGEGLFEVAVDALRPFVVRAAGGTTRALGTRFDVKNVDGLVTVAVDKHAVSVALPGAAEVRLDEGWQVSYGPDRLGTPTLANIDTVEAWRRNRMVFQDVPLRRVLAELERYRHGRIVLADRAIGDIPVTAIFDTNQADNALQTIAETLPIRIFYATRYLAVVTSAG